MNPSRLVTKKPRQSDLDYLIGRYLKETSNTGAPGLIRFMEAEAKAKCTPGARIEWTDPTGQVHKNAIKTVENKLSEMKVKRRQ
jgi:hypothetical protein